MEEELKDYLVIPRKLISWHPIIDTTKCKGCRTCVKACKHNAFSYDESEKKAFVANPYYCEVFCQSCQFQCPEEVISFPDKNETKKIFRELRKQYPPK
ncbi:MAG: 4Fe-4S binding protein [Candidatus Omnitrophica bacterium]|nr:4Fe-4S binding protein [Candidatus Omnitrophota bacterium]